jgi:hypothetical protein
MLGSESVIEKRLQRLKSHLQRENPSLLEAVDSFRELDRLAHRMGLLESDRSYATMIPFWPLITVFGSCSSGKSSFINHYLGMALQSTDSQAEDERFTLLCHGREQQINVLPGLALDADPRFPFYQFSDELEKLAEGEGQKIDAYLQLKTCPAEVLRGKILIESPGLDADDQDGAILRISEHLIGQSDLVLVFFDARYLESDVMLDIEHLLARSQDHPVVSKFIYVLNQNDTNIGNADSEDMFAAWQGALAKKGLSAGHFYTIREPDAGFPNDSEEQLHRDKNEPDADLSALHERIAQVEIERTYRIVGNLASTAKQIERHAVPLLRRALQRWRRRTLIADGAAFIALAALAIALLFHFSPGVAVLPSWPMQLDPDSHPHIVAMVLVMLYVVILGIHYRIRTWIARGVVKWIGKQGHNQADTQALQNGFLRNTRFWCSIYSQEPVGWGKKSRRLLHKLVADADRYVLKLNDRFANPSGYVVPSSRESSSEKNS